jgi:hypothetical protein
MNAKKIFFFLWLSLPFALLAQESESSVNIEPVSPIQYTMLLEGGINTASPVSVGGEFVFMHGLTFQKKHLFALAFGIGGGYIESYQDENWTDRPFYMPFYFTYRYYFRPDKKFTPMVSSALGGLINYSDKQLFGGCYASFCTGFKVRKFYLLGGLNFTSMQSYVESYYDCSTYTRTQVQWIFPVGLMLHVGIAF